MQSKCNQNCNFSQNVKACHYFSMNHFSEWHVITFRRFGGTFYVMNVQKLAILAGLRSIFYTSISQKYGQARNTTTQNTQQPTWDAPALPPSGFVLSLYGSASGATNKWCWGYQSTQARCPALGLRLTWLVPLFWVPYRDHSKIRETGREVALWPKLNKNTQQPTVNWQYW